MANKVTIVMAMVMYAARLSRVSKSFPPSPHTMSLLNSSCEVIRVGKAAGLGSGGGVAKHIAVKVRWKVKAFTLLDCGSTFNSRVSPPQ